MRLQTPQKRVQFTCALRTVVLGVFAVFVAVAALSLLESKPIAAATSSYLNFQARLETASGAIAPDGNYNVEFKLYNALTSSGSSQGSCTGDAACLWTEDHTYNSGPGATDARIRVANGYLTVSLGSITAFGSINWNQQLYITMRIGGISGTSTTWDTEMSPRLQLTAVPYAFQAGALGNGTNQAVLDSSGNLTLQQASTLSTSTGQLTVQGATSLVLQSTTSSSVTLDSGTTGGINIGTGSNAKTITIGNTTGGTTLNIQSGTGGINLQSAATVAANLTVTNAGNVAFQKGSDYSTPGGTNNVNFGTGTLIRLTGASTQTITGIANGVDGKLLTIVNTAGQSAIISNLSGSSLAANQISTGTGNDVTLSPGASVNLVYDAGDSLWRVIGGIGGTGAGGYIQLQGSTPGTIQTGNFNITGTGILSTLQSASGTTGSTLTVQAGASTGGTNTGGTLLLQGGAGASTGASGSVIVKANTHDSTTAFQVQNAGGSALLTADTTNTRITSTGSLIVSQTGSCDYNSFVGTISSLGPTGYWKLEDVSGTTAADSSGNGNTGSISSTGVTLNQTPGPFVCASSHPYMQFVGSSTGGITTTTSISNPQIFTLMTLFKTTSGGPLISFTDNGANHDRQIYVGSDGKLHFFMWNGSGQTLTSPSIVNDGAWHIATATLSGSGMALYVDGVQVASNSQTNPTSYTGHWDIGYESATSGGTDSTQYFTGSISQAVVTGSVSAGTIATFAREAERYQSSPISLGVNIGTPQYPLDVVGDINTSTEYRIAGVVICTSSGCAPSAGSNNYVQLQGSSPSAQTGYFNISGTGIAGALQASTIDSASSVALTIGNTHAASIGIGNTTSNIATTINGTALIKPTSGNDSAAVFQIQNAAATTTLLNVDSTVNKVTLNSSLVVNTSTPSPLCSYSNYISQVTGQSPTIYWKLEDSSGSTAADSSGNSNNGSISATGVTLNQTPGAFSCASSHPVMTFNGTSSGYIISGSSFTNPTTFSLVALFKTSSDGDIISFSNTGSSNYDRTIYVGGNGKLYAGIYNGSVNTINSTATVNDNNWHLAIMTYSSTSGGLKLYLDGSLVASNTSLTGSNNVSDWWVVGHMPNIGWSSTLVDPYFTGSISQVAVFPSILSSTTISNLAQYSGYTTGNASGVGIGLVGSPSYLLDVGGDINTSTQYRVAGTVICTSSGCAPSAGSNNYVQLQGSSPSAQTGYFNITGTGIAGALQAGSLDVATAGVLTIGNATATAINLGNTTSNILTTINGTALVKPTSGHDSTTAFQVQNAAGTASILNVDTTNRTLTAHSGNDIRTLGSELYSGNFSSGWTATGWDVSSGTTAYHNTGNTSSLVNTNVAITAGTTYVVSLQLSTFQSGPGTCAVPGGESLTVYIGGTQIGKDIGEDCSAPSSTTFVGTASNTTGLTFTPTSNWPGHISSISIKALSGIINPVLVVQNMSSSPSIEVRANANTSNTYIGVASGSNDIGGSNNAALGAKALQSNLSGTDNTAIGAYTLQLNSFGHSNTAIGSNALAFNTNGYLNTALGYTALNVNTTGSDNTAIGENTLSSNTAGINNSAVGSNALSSNTGGSGNVGIGYSAAGNNTDGSYNIGLGVNALDANTTGSKNTGLGFDAGYQDLNGGFKTLSALQNATAIGAYAQVQASNSIVLGSVDAVAKVGIGSTIPLNTFSVSPVYYNTGTAWQSGTTISGSGTTWTSAMVGMQFIFSTGQTATITGFTNATTLTASVSQTVSASTGITYRIHTVGFQVTSAGNTYIQNTSTTAFQVQNAAGTANVLNVDTTNQTTTLRAGSDTSTSTTLYNSNNYTSGWTTTGWTATATSATHTTGNTNALVNTSVSVTTGTTYVVDWATSGSCGGASDTITVSIGGVTLKTQDGTKCGASVSYIATATTTAGLTITPTTNWSGTLNWISIYQITSVVNPVFVVQNTSGSASLEVRASSGASSTYVGLNSGAYDAGSTDNTALGAQSLQYNTWGYNNVAVGDQALQRNTEGFQDVAVGAAALGNNTTGHDNVGLGQSALAFNLSGTSNLAIGSGALEFNTIGNHNTAFGGLLNNTSGSGNVSAGAAALNSNITGSDNMGLGFEAGYQDLNGGFKTLSALQNASAIGAYAQVQASNSIVLGSVDNATLVGVGITVPNNTFSVSPLDYQAGKATRTNSSATLTGTSTTWTSAMVGDLIVFADGTTNTVSAFTDATHITMGTTYAGTTDASPVNYRFHHVGLQVSSLGRVGLGTTSPGSILNISTLVTNDGIVLDGLSKHAWFSTNLGSGTLNNITQSGDEGIFYGGTNAGVGTPGFDIAPWVSGAASGIHLDAAGKVGIGTGTPGYALDVSGDVNASGVFRSGGTAGVTTTCTGTQALNGITIKGGIITAGSCATNAADVAEQYGSTQSLVPGEIVAIAAGDYRSVERSSVAGQPNLLGIVSTNPYQVMGNDQPGYPIALAGRVPTEVDLEGGVIHKGDKITSSSTPGVGMKASGAGMVVGTALEDYSGSGVGEIEVFVGLSYYDPLSLLQGTSSFTDLNVSGIALVKNLTVSGIATFQGDIVVAGHIITGGNTPVAAALSAAGTDDQGRVLGACTVTGNDTSGTVTLTTGTQNVYNGSECTITFVNAFSSAPRPIVSPLDTDSVGTGVYIHASSTDMQVMFSNAPQPNHTYAFNYWNPQ